MNRLQRTVKVDLTNAVSLVKHGVYNDETRNVEFFFQNSMPTVFRGFAVQNESRFIDEIPNLGAAPLIALFNMNLYKVEMSTLMR